jgi:hypothetical protein
MSKVFQGWTTMACHVYDPIYCKVMFIAIYDMKLEDTETQCIVWTKMNAIILKKGVANPNFKGMKQTMPKQIRMLFVLFMGLGILL